MAEYRLLRPSEAWVDYANSFIHKIKINKGRQQLLPFRQQLTMNDFALRSDMGRFF